MRSITLGSSLFGVTIRVKRFWSKLILYRSNRLKRPKNDLRRVDGKNKGEDVRATERAGTQ